ncbi:MAG TPA: GTPase Era [Candidatus Azoamicus sp.]
MNKNIITIIGKTNVGKSSLTNNLSKNKISIITPKKNTTIQCVISKINKNLTLIDTPGPIIKNDEKNINKLIYNAINNARTLLIVIDKIFLNSEDLFIMELVKKSKKEKILLINKIDTLKEKLHIIPFIKKIKKKYPEIKEIIPISNKNNVNINQLKKSINIDTYNRYKKIENIKNFISELTRETLLNKLEKEIPYTTKINICNKKITKTNKVIILDLIVKKESQKKIIIGKEGKKINEIITSLKNKLINKLPCIEKIKITINVNKK